MAEVDPVILELIARNDRYVTNLRNTTRVAEQSLGAQERRVVSLERQFSRSGAAIGRTLGTLAAGFATIATAREFLRLVDASKQIEAQLRLATRESGSFAQAQEDVRRIAAQTRSGLDETARLYSVFVRDSAALGISQLEAARATETLTKSFLISGASAEETSGATRQLIQGLQSGTLRGDEFNSVMEQAPRLQKLFAAALGVSKGELRSMAEEGKITAAALVDALTNTKFTKGIDEEFREMPVTFDQAMQQVENAATITFGAFDRGGGFSQMLANFITDGTAGFEELEQSAVETGIQIRAAFEGLGDVFLPMLEGARSVFGQIGLEGQSLRQQISNTLGEWDAMANWLNPNSSIDAVIDEKLWGIKYAPSNLQGRFNAGATAAERNRRAALEGRAELDRRAALAAQGAPAVRPGGGGGGGSSRRRGPSAESIAAKAERERLQAIRDEGEKQRDMLSLQDDIIAARAALATAAEDVARFELQQIGIEQAARLSKLNTELRLGELSKAEYEARATALAEEIGLRRQAIERQRDEAVADRELEAQRETLRQQADQKALEADALLARADIVDTLEQRAFLEESALAIQQEIERSLLEQAIAEGKVADAAAARAALASRQSSEMIGQGRRNQGALGNYLDGTSDPRAAAEEAAVREIQNVRDGLADGLAEQLGTKNQFVKDLFSIFLDQVIFRPLAEAMRGAGGGGGGFFGNVFGAVAGMFGGGGIPGFANGGSMTLGGRGGTDNNILSLNNAPLARVSRGELLNISPNRRLASASGGGGAPTIYVDARGSVMNDKFAATILSQAKGYAAEAGARSYQQAMKDAPGRVRSAQRYGS